MFAQAGDGSGAQVARDADFQRDVALAQAVHEARIFGRANAVSDALGTDFERIPYSLGACGLARVACQAQGASASFRGKIAGPAGGSLILNIPAPDGAPP